MEALEHVVLVNKFNKVIGIADKISVHTRFTPLHRAFSCFIFNKKGQILLQQRSHKKITWPLIWTNSCCGHPEIGETNEEAVLRRLQFELEITDVELHEILPDYRYHAEHNGVVENELCPVWIGFSDQEPKVNSDEIENTKWMDWVDFVALTKINKGPMAPLSEWCIEETDLLENNARFQELMAERLKN